MDASLLDAEAANSSATNSFIPKASIKRIMKLNNEVTNVSAVRHWCCMITYFIYIITALVKLIEFDVNLLTCSFNVCMYHYEVLIDYQNYIIYLSRKPL